MATVDKIKRNLIWLRRTLGIIDKTTLPGTISGEVRPGMDTLGWDRLQNLEIASANAAAPAIVVASTAVPPGVLRYIHSCSVSHSDTGVEHEASLNKRRNPANFNVGIPTDRRLINFNQFCSMIGHTFIRENEFLIGSVVGVPVVGNLSLRFFFVDLDLGEYVYPM